MVATPRTNAVDASDVGKALLELNAATSGIVARAGGGQANATALVATYNRVATVASAADSVKLPLARPGAMVMVANRGANSMNVFPQTGEEVNVLGANAAYAMAAAARAVFFCALSGKWEAGTLA